MCRAKLFICCLNFAKSIQKKYLADGNTNVASEYDSEFVAMFVLGSALTQNKTWNDTR